MTKVEKMMCKETIKGYKECIGPRAMKLRAQSEHQKRHHLVEASLSKDSSATQRKERWMGGVWPEPGGESARCRRHSLAMWLLPPVPKVPRVPEGKEGFPCQKQSQRVPRGILECNHKR